MDVPSFDIHGVLSALSSFLTDNREALLSLAASMAGAAGGAIGAISFMNSRENRKNACEIQAICNATIAVLVALLGKLINFKKDLAFPAEQEAQKLRTMLDETATVAAAGGEKTRLSIGLDLWPETPMELRLPDRKIYVYAAAELDLIQLLKMLESNLSELSFLVRQRNMLIHQMNTHQASKGALPLDGIDLYVKYSGLILRNTDENLFFIDKSIVRIRDAARKLLPESLHATIADVGLKAEAVPVMPPKDLIKGWVK